MIRSYMKKEKEYVQRFGERTMFLLQCGSFYEVYCCKKKGEFTNTRITEFSRICDMRIANKRSKCDGLSVFMSGFPELHLEKYVKKLNDAGWTVAVHCQDPSCPSIRKELGIFSPGTNFESDEGGSNRTMTVWIEVYNKTLLNKKPRVSCGIACVDISSGDVHTFQCVENYFHNPTTFDELERFYCSYKPNELIIIHNCEDKQINDIISFADIESRLIHKVDMNDATSEWSTAVSNAQKQTYQEAELTRYYSIKDYDIFYETHSLREREFALRSLVFLLNFLDFHNHGLVKQLKLPLFTNVKDRVRLANHSLRQLNIIDIGNKSKFSSLLSLVNKCKTAMGRRYLTQQILNPTTNCDYLNNEYQILEHLSTKYDSGDTWQDLFSSLTHITDFERLFRKLILKRVVPADLAVLADNLTTIKKTRKVVDTDSKISEYLANTTLVNSHLKKLLKKIKTTLNIKAAGSVSCRDFDINIFNSGIFPELDAAEEDYKHSLVKLDAIKDHLAKIIPKEKKPIKIHHTEKSGLYLMMTKKRFRSLMQLEKAMRDKGVPSNVVEYKYKGEDKSIDLDIGDIKESKASGSNVRLDSSVITKLYHKISQTKSNYKEILQSTFDKFVESFLQYKVEFETIIAYVTKLDFLLARGYVNKQYNYCKPVIDTTAEQSFIDAKQIRHPLIEHINTNELYVPNDISLGKNALHTGVLLFGTNAVGKSSLIRSIGMSIVLAQSGFFVPCSSFIYNPYNAIFTRILGNDDIFKGLSTFAVEMTELNAIIRGADDNSLILGDELCSGTETTSALCIVSAGIELLHKKKSSFVFATHFHELTEREELMDLGRLSLQHMVVRYDEQSGVLIYDRKLRDGPGNKLYGLEVCKALSMPQEFQVLANKYRCKYGMKQNTSLGLKKSRYNSNKLRDKCELCGRDATEVHHMQPQCDADANGFISHFSKNHKANLMNICRVCHDKLTRQNIKHKRTKTSEGTRLDVI